MVPVVAGDGPAIPVDTPGSALSGSPTPMEDMQISVSLPVSDLLSSARSQSPLNAAEDVGKGKGTEIEVLEVIDKSNQRELQVQSEDGSRTEQDDEEEDDADYERRRARQILENQRLIASLGLRMSDNNASSSSFPSAGLDGPSQLSPKRYKRRRALQTVTIYDRSGHIISLPQEGRTHTMACVEMPSDRRLRKQIADGEYQDCSKWKEGEDRRWRFGMGRGGQLVEGEDEEVGGVGEDFRWRRWKGLRKELEREARRLGKFMEQEARPQPIIIPDGVSAYSLIPGETCHQCRRKSEQPKMKCRNINPICRATFCETCCKRYSYFEFDEEARSFICPLCRDCCNCSQCIRKRNLVHLLGTTTSKDGFKKQSMRKRMSEMTTGIPDGMTVQAWLELAAGKEEVIKAPFDRVRIVDQATDVVSPDLPEEEMEVVVVSQPQKKMAKKRKRPILEEANGEGNHDVVLKLKGKRGRKKKVVNDKDNEKVDKANANANANEKSKGSLVVRLKLPKSDAPEKERRKEVDSDGDTVGDWSDDEDERENNSDSSSLTPLSSEGTNSPPIPARFAFPPRQPTVTSIDPSSAFVPQTLAQAQVQVSIENEDETEMRPLGHITSQNITITTATSSPKHTVVPSGSAHSSPESTNNDGDAQDQPHCKRKPPPKANIVRAPRHNSIPITESTPTPLSGQADNSNPNFLMVTNLVNPNHDHQPLGTNTNNNVGDGGGGSGGPLLSAPLWETQSQSYEPSRLPNAKANGCPTFAPPPPPPSTENLNYYPTLSYGYSSNPAADPNPNLPPMPMSLNIGMGMGMDIPPPLSFNYRPAQNTITHQYNPHSHSHSYPPPYSHSPTRLPPLTLAPVAAQAQAQAQVYQSERQRNDNNNNNDMDVIDDDRHCHNHSDTDGAQNLHLLNLAVEAKAKHPYTYPNINENNRRGQGQGPSQEKDYLVGQAQRQRFWPVDR